MARKPYLDLKPWPIHNSTGISSWATGTTSSNFVVGRKTYAIFCDNAGTCHSFRKGSSKCLYTWTVLKALKDVVSGTMSIVSIFKTRRCSGQGEIIADAIAKGGIPALDNIGLANTTWLRPSRVLMDWIKKPVVTPQLGKQLLDELSVSMEVVLPTSCLITQELNECY